MASSNKMMSSRQPEATNKVMQCNSAQLYNDKKTEKKMCIKTAENLNQRHMEVSNFTPLQGQGEII
jgi:hypothetical protein